MRKGIDWFETENKIKAQVRFKRTLKTKMHKYFTTKETISWINVQDDLVCNYIHSFLS